MPLQVTPAIPADRIVDIIPSVLPAGGASLDMIGIVLTDSPRVPIGEVMSFVTTEDVDNYFGTLIQESALGAVYFLGYNNSTAKPAKLLFTQYNTEDVSSWLRSGSLSALTLAAFQAITGSLTVTINGVDHTVNAVDLSAATSFSDGAQRLGTQLGILGALGASVTGSINDGSASFTGSIASNLMTVTAVGSGTLYPGSTLSGTGGGGVAAGTTIIQQLTGTVGGTGVYQVSAAQTVSSTTITASRTDGVLEVTAVSSGSIEQGQVLQGTGAGITATTYVTGLLTGSGATGSYSVNNQQTVGSQSISLYAPGAEYDSVLRAIQINSDTAGLNSSIDFATGTAAATLRLTEATGALVSQGAAAATPYAFMDNIITLTQDWVSFMTNFEPAEADKIEFARWTNAKQNRYMYVMWDTNIVNTETTGPSAAVETINENDYSGIAMIYEDPSVDTTGAELAAFLMGAVGSLDFTRTNGRATMAFRSQSGLAPQIFNGTVADNLIGYGLNFYGDYTTANQAFTWFYPGQISGDFKWIDSYVNQIWLNNELQLALMVLLGSVGSIPYNAAGYALIEAACIDPITAAVNFGAIRPGVTLSAAQIAQVNSLARIPIDTTLSARGWYLQIKDAAPEVRAARGSPPMTLWYMDGQSVQKITLASIEVQ